MQKIFLFGSCLILFQYCNLYHDFYYSRFAQNNLFDSYHQIVTERGCARYTCSTKYLFFSMEYKRSHCPYDSVKKEYLCTAPADLSALDSYLSLAAICMLQSTDYPNGEFDRMSLEECNRKAVRNL